MSSCRRPEHPGTPISQKAIRRLRERQRAYDRDPEAYCRRKREHTREQELRRRERRHMEKRAMERAAERKAMERQRAEQARDSDGEGKA